MKIKYFADTDTLYIEFRRVTVAESLDFDENTILDLDESGALCGITVEHAGSRIDLPQCSFERVDA